MSCNHTQRLISKHLLNVFIVCIYVKCYIYKCSQAAYYC